MPRARTTAFPKVWGRRGPRKYQIMEIAHPQFGLNYYFMLPFGSSKAVEKFLSRVLLKKFKDCYNIFKKPCTNPTLTCARECCKVADCLFSTSKNIGNSLTRSVSSCVSATFSYQRDRVCDVKIAETARTRCETSRTKSRLHHLRACQPRRRQALLSVYACGLAYVWPVCFHDFRLGFSTRGHSLEKSLSNYTEKVYAQKNSTPVTLP